MSNNQSKSLECSAQVADLRLALQRAEQQQARKEDYLREEISELQQVAVLIVYIKQHNISKVLYWAVTGAHITLFVLSSSQRLQEAETRNQELSQSVTSATRPLLRQIENLQASLGGQAASWEKLEKNISDRLGKRGYIVLFHISLGI